MNPFNIFSTNKKKALKHDETVAKNSFKNSLTIDDNFSILYVDPFIDSYLCNAWINIAVNILIRNLARADFILEREGVEIKNGPLYSLFHRPNENLSRYDLWKETAAWWFIEGEAFWWFGPYSTDPMRTSVDMICGRRPPPGGL